MDQVLISKDGKKVVTVSTAVIEADSGACFNIVSFEGVVLLQYETGFTEENGNITYTNLKVHAFNNAIALSGNRIVFKNDERIEESINKLYSYAGKPIGSLSTTNKEEVPFVKRSEQDIDEMIKHFSSKQKLTTEKAKNK